jgi:hypothetical protein
MTPTARLLHVVDALPIPPMFRGVLAAQLAGAAADDAAVAAAATAAARALLWVADGEGECPPPLTLP